MATYFTDVAGEHGLNPTPDNPCRLIDFARLVLRTERRMKAGPASAKCCWWCSAGAAR